MGPDSISLDLLMVLNRSRCEVVTLYTVVGLGHEYMYIYILIQVYKIVLFLFRALHVTLSRMVSNIWTSRRRRYLERVSLTPFVVACR